MSVLDVLPNKSEGLFLLGRGCRRARAISVSKCLPVIKGVISSRRLPTPAYSDHLIRPGTVSSSSPPVAHHVPFSTFQVGRPPDGRLLPLSTKSHGFELAPLTRPDAQRGHERR